jgi:hypothetical protein
MRPLSVVSGLIMLLSGCADRDRERVDPTAGAFEEFSKRVDEYVTLRNRLADSAGTVDENMDQQKIADRASGLAAAILSARPQAKQGDIFTPEAATVFATMIKEEYSRRPPPVLDAREDTQEELPNFTPEVNQLYPTTYPLATFPPALLPLLPRLPEQLEYRVVQHYLILRDVEANLIVDFMPNAMPST